MSIANRLLALAAPVALLALSACATGFPAQVSRFQAMPAPQGQSFIIQPADAADRGGLEFAQYAGLVRQHLVAQGYSEAPSAQAATLLVSLDYGVDEGQRRTASAPPLSTFNGFGWSHPFYRPYYSRYGYRGYRRSPFYWGWNDPYAYGPFGLDNYGAETVHTSFLTMNIKRAGDGQAVFEGRAKARSASGELTALVPNLIEAMFTKFPGKSGETVRITVPPAARAQ
jgi:hypothetical protein